MAWRTGSASRFLNATRSPSIRPTTAVRRPPSPLLVNSRRLSFTNPRNLEVLGCVQSLMPMYNVVVAAVADARLTSRIEFDPRACCQLSKAELPDLLTGKQKNSLKLTVELVQGAL